MAVKSSGSLSMKTDIVGEFGGTSPHGLKEYYRNGSLVPDASENSNIPTSGEIGYKDFYGATSIVSITGHVAQITVSDYISSGGTLSIPSSYYVYSNNTGVAALTIDIPCTILNSGKIIGKGGNGGAIGSAGSNGGNAIKINSGVTGVTITNNSGAYIAGGGGGGGGRTQTGTNSAGGGGGAGGGSGSAGLGGTRAFDAGASKFAGGYGGGFINNRGTYAGQAGGYRLPGVGGTGTDAESSVGASSLPNGGSAANAGQASFGSNTSGGGGGWGASGGAGNSHSGGSGGKAIEDSGNSYSLTNNGTIYGATT